MVEYKYSAWGTQLSRTGELANTLGYANPFRYRGYIYDDETWMYWLRSRYYYPELHRFISADNVMNGAGLFSANLYAYCKNAPVGASDPSGHFLMSAGAVLYGIAGVLAAALTAVAVDIAADKIEHAIPVLPGKSIDREINITIAFTLPFTLSQTRTETATDTNQKRKQAGVHLHHVVAKADWRAAPARKVLTEYDIDVWNSPHNLVFVPADRHARLHTNAYYLYVNSKMIVAKRSGGRAGVIRTLELLKLEILAGTII